MAGRLILGITRRCVSPFSLAPSTTPLFCHPSTEKVVYAEPSRELSHTRTVASSGASSADVGAGRIHGRSRVRGFSVRVLLARAPELGGSKPGWQPLKQAAWSASTFVRVASYVRGQAATANSAGAESGAVEAEPAEAGAGPTAGAALEGVVGGLGGPDGRGWPDMALQAALSGVRAPRARQTVASHGAKSETDSRRRRLHEEGSLIFKAFWVGLGSVGPEDERTYLPNRMRLRRH